MNLSQAPTDAPINLFFHDGSVNIINDRPDVVSIDPHDTIERAKQISPADWQSLKASANFMRLFRLVFPDAQLPDHPLQMHGSGVRHVVGLLVLTFTALREGKTPFWRLPESYLHPSAQVGLGDLLIQLTNSNPKESQ